MLKILIVDDNKIVVEGYTRILSISRWQDNLAVNTVNSCEDAIRIFVEQNSSYDILIMEVFIHSFDSDILLCLKKITVLAKKHFPSSKILITTSHTDIFTLINLIKEINPEGLIIKRDLTKENFLMAIERLLHGGTFYSAFIKSCNKTLSVNPIFLDDRNRRIVILLAKGIKTKNLPLHLNLSISAIDKRKAQIREIFNIEKGTDEDIIREARNNGFI